MFNLYIVVADLVSLVSSWFLLFVFGLVERPTGQTDDD